MKLKELLIEIRIKKDISQTELADILDIYQRQLSFYETGRAFPRSKTLAKIVKLAKNMGMVVIENELE